MSNLAMLVGFLDLVFCCNVAIGWEGYLANGGPQGPIYGQNRQRTASNRLLESHRKQSSNGLQHIYWCNIDCENPMLFDAQSLPLKLRDSND